MSTVTDFITPHQKHPHLRPFDIRRDLRSVADLVEMCFADTLDPDGERYLQQMRNTARNSGFLRLASAAKDWSGIPLSGFVWEQDGRLVGNVSLIPYRIHGKRCYLIANVAVHPDYRRQGIASQLTDYAIDQARNREAASVWLHVRNTNETAIRLYASRQFVERARRTTWISLNSTPLGDIPPEVQVAPRRAVHWDFQEKVLKRDYPKELSWHLPLKMKALRPGILGSLRRFLTNTYVHQWSAGQTGQLMGVLAWQGTFSYADSLWLAVRSGHEDTAAFALLLHARQRLSPRKKLSLDYPAGKAQEGIQAAGFFEQQTLIWMEKEL